MSYLARYHWLLIEEWLLGLLLNRTDRLNSYSLNMTTTSKGVCKASKRCWHYGLVDKTLAYHAEGTWFETHRCHTFCHNVSFIFCLPFNFFLLLLFCPIIRNIYFLTFKIFFNFLTFLTFLVL